MIGCENFGQMAPRIFSQAHYKPKFMTYMGSCD